MTEPRHFHSARKGSGSLRSFPIYPLYTQAEILSLDKPIADCFLFRPRRSCEKRRKRSHTNASNTLVTRTSTPPAQTPHAPKQGPSLPRPQQGFALPVKSLQSLHLQPLILPRFYIHTFPGSLRTLTISNSSISDHLSSRFSTSRTNGPRSLSRAKVGTHSAFGEGSHTRAYTPKQGPSLH